MTTATTPTKATDGPRDQLRQRIRDGERLAGQRSKIISAIENLRRTCRERQQAIADECSRATAPLRGQLADADKAIAAAKVARRELLESSPLRRDVERLSAESASLTAALHRLRTELDSASMCGDTARAKVYAAQLTRMKTTLADAKHELDGLIEKALLG